jgi:hypothetical protein
MYVRILSSDSLLQFAITVFVIEKENIGFGTKN